MNKVVSYAFASLFLLAPLAHAEPPSNCDNFGQLTQWSILENDHDQGAHSSDPTGDGQGPGTGDEPRSGLANIVETGNISASLALLVFLLNPPDC